MSWFALLFLMSFVYAQTDLDPIEVEASKDLERYNFSSSQSLKSQDFEGDPQGLVTTALEKAPGLIATQNGGPGGRVAFFIRGTESRHVAFTLDDLKINDPSNTDRQFDAAFLTSPFLKEIIVHQGSHPVLYGSDALGGMVEMKTRKGEDAPETRLSVNGGSFGTIGSSLSSDWKTKKHQGTLTATKFHSDGISRINDKRFGASEKDATDITQILSSSQHRYGEKFQTDLLFSYLHGKAEQDAYGSDNSNDYSRNDQYIAQQKTNYEINDSQAVSLRNGLNRHQRHNESLSADSEFFNGEILQNEFIHRWEKNHFGVISGLSSEKEAAKAIGMDRSFDIHSAFTQGAVEWSEFKFHLSARADRHTRYGSFYTGGGGLGWREFSFQYSRGYKAPSLYQLYGPDSFGAPVGNPDLVPETNHSMELAWRKKTDSLEGGVTLFQNRLRNLFTYSFTEGYLNQQRFITEGVEVSGRVSTASFVFKGSFTHQNFKDEEAPVLRRPYNMAQVGVSYFPVESVELNLTERWFSARKDFGTVGITKLNGYEVLDFSIRKTWEKDDVAVQVKNVLDREYEDVYGYSVMPRAIFAHYGHRF